MTAAAPRAYLISEHARHARADPVIFLRTVVEDAMHDAIVLLPKVSRS
jgi:hypothetical protein